MTNYLRNLVPRDTVAEFVQCKLIAELLILPLELPHRMQRRIQTRLNFGVE